MLELTPARLGPGAEILQCETDYNAINMRSSTKTEPTGTEHRVARLTILIDPTKKRIFEEICSAQDLTPSQWCADSSAST